MVQDLGKLFIVEGLDILVKQQKRLSLCWAGATDRGPQREENEDAFLAGNFLGKDSHRLQHYGKLSRQEIPLFAVADGLGGHEDGGLASRHALSFLNYEFTCSIKEWRDIPFQLQQAYRNIHTKLSSLTTYSLHPMGTTLTSVLFTSDYGVVAHAGDTQLWQLQTKRQGQPLSLLTEDHNQAWKTTKISDRSFLTSFLGGGLITPRIDVFSFPFDQDDFFLLNSDGLVEGLSHEKIRQVLLSPDTTLVQKAMELVTQALKDSLDNVTALVIQVLHH